MNRLITEALRNQFDSTFHMASILVNVCPEKIWAASYNEVPFCNRFFIMFTLLISGCVRSMMIVNGVQ